MLNRKTMEKRVLMGIVGEVKCGRCDRKYSALRGRCPYCGARKNHGGKRSAYAGNDKWQLIAGIIILIAIIVTVVVLIATSLKNKGKDGNTDGTPDPTPPIPAGEDIDSVDGTPASPDPTDTGTDDPVPPTDSGAEVTTPTTPVVTVQSIELNREDFTLSRIGEQWQMKATITPADTGLEVVWTSNDENVCIISSTGLVTAINKGYTTIVATVGDKTAECIVRVTATASTGGNGTGTTEPTGDLTLSHTDVTISASSSESFKLTVSGTTSTPTYTVGNSSVATVDSSGKVTAVSAGYTIVKVTVDGQTLECIVRVK